MLVTALGHLYANHWFCRILLLFSEYQTECVGVIAVHFIPAMVFTTLIAKEILTENKNISSSIKRTYTNAMSKKNLSKVNICNNFYIFVPVVSS